MRVVLVDDAPLVRAGIARLLSDEGVYVVTELPDATGLLPAVQAHRPDAVIIDVRMPPTHTTEGLQASVELKRQHPNVGVLVLSQHIETRHAVELLAGGHQGVGYLLKERIARSAELVDAVQRVAEGGMAIDPEVVRTVFETPRRSDPLAGLTARERDVLAFVAEGLSNDRIAERLAVTSPRPWRPTRAASSASWAWRRTLQPTAVSSPSWPIFAPLVAAQLRRPDSGSISTVMAERRQARPVAAPAPGHFRSMTLRPRVERSIGRLPRLVWRALALTRSAAPRQLAAAAALQLVSAVVLGGQLLVGRGLLAGVTTETGGGGFGAVVPELAAFAALGAAGAIAGLMRIEHQRLLTERVSRYAAAQVLAVSASVELVAFERPTFFDRLQRAQVNAEVRPAQVTTGLLGVAGGLFSAAGIAVALLVLQPVVLAFVLVAYIPAWYASYLGTRVPYDFVVHQTGHDRRRTYLYMLLSRREEAAEVRSFGLGPVLREQHHRLFAERIGDLESVVRRRLRLGIAGQAATAALTAAAGALLVWQVTTQRLSVATGVAAAGAIVVFGSRLTSLVGSAGQLHEASMFLEDFTTFVDWHADEAATDRRAAAPEGFSALVVEGVSFRYPSRSTSLASKTCRCGSAPARSSPSWVRTARARRRWPSSSPASTAERG